MAPRGAQNIETGNYNTGFGYFTFNNGNDGNYVGNYNVAVGYETLYKSSSALYNSNTAVGYSVMEANNVYSHNTGVGYQAINDLSTGIYNTAVGYNAYAGVTLTGSYNSALGYSTLVGAALTNTTQIGAYADDASNSNTIVLGAIPGTNSYGTVTSPIVNVCIGTNTPDTHAALAIATGHIETQGAVSSVTPPTAGSGTTTVSGTDVGGLINATPSSSVSAITVTFAKAYTTVPKVVLTPANAAAAAAMITNQVYVSSTASNFAVNFGVAATAANYQFNYFVIETQ
jgi:hypothetical protein